MPATLCHYVGGTTCALDRRRTAVRATSEALFIALGILLYFAIRGLVANKADIAYANAHRLMELERDLGIAFEQSLQQTSLQFASVGSLANWIYIWGHWPVIIGTLVWLVLRRRDLYPVYRNALLISGIAGLCIFATFPVAPPRFFESMGFVDTITLQSNAYRVLQPPSLANPYAALPSFHFGWNLLMAIALVRHAYRPVVRLIGVVMPLAMLWAIVVTANHFIIDGVLGGLLVVTSLWLSKNGVPGLRAIVIEGTAMIRGDALERKPGE